MSNQIHRIAMLSVHSCPMGNPGTRDTGGMSIYIRAVARELGKLGIGVDVFTRLHDANENLIIELGDKARLIHLSAGVDMNINKQALYAYLAEFAGNLEQYRSSNNLSYDLIFSHYWLSGKVGKILAKLWAVPHALMFHTLGAAKNAIGIGEAETGLRLLSEETLSHEADLIIAATEQEKNDLLCYYHASPRHISVVPCGVNLELFRPLDRLMARQRLGFNSEKIALFAGRIEPLKGLDRLLRAVASLHHGNRPRLVIIGGDEYSQPEIERLRNLSRQLSIDGSINFRGLVKHEELPYYYNAADVCVVPSFYETFGLVALEAIACGTPVVVNDVGGARSFVRQNETGYIVANNEPHRLADKINLLLSREKASPDLFRASVREFSWAHIARKLRGCFNSIGEYPVLKGDEYGD